MKEVPPGEGVGYGLAYCAQMLRRITVLTIGYGDGLPKALSNGVGRVLMRGHCAPPIVGLICMDQTIVDVTEIPGVEQGDTTVLIGRDGRKEISVFKLEERCSTINNEVLSRLGARMEWMMVDRI